MNSVRGARLAVRPTQATAMQLAAAAMRAMRLPGETLPCRTDTAARAGGETVIDGKYTAYGERHDDVPFDSDARTHARATHDRRPDTRRLLANHGTRRRQHAGRSPPPPQRQHVESRDPRAVRQPVP